MDGCFSIREAVCLRTIRLLELTTLFITVISSHHLTLYGITAPDKPEEISDIAPVGYDANRFGERFYTRSDFRPYLEQRAIDIAQPDVSHCGGISELYRIASLAEVYGVALAPHCPLGAISLAICTAVAISVRNWVALVLFDDMTARYSGNELNGRTRSKADLHTYLLNLEMFDIEYSYIITLQGTGHGILVNEERVREFLAKYVNGHPI
ncbi:hypothetical protein AMATHDRAFT_49828 [Amanita thiersii Skay4041]|uniref:Enolase C-terminal domain-containing protein n=1 Tax=Amanita thiersii Skay4041 TaxID=703135 RepID=A0A2A9ND95_9AGAR|nr:hypothetical protein AMATHDRAFT_49828 [Amanita thiersii Skay4041]